MQIGRTRPEVVWVLKVNHGLGEMNAHGRLEQGARVAYRKSGGYYGDGLIILFGTGGRYVWPIYRETARNAGTGVGAVVCEKAF